MATGVSVNPAMSSTTMYPGPPPPYAYPSNPVSSIPPPSHSLSPAPRRSMELDKDPLQSQPPRQSLPSIHEALGNENPLPYPGHPSAGAPSHSAHHHPPPPNVLSRPSAEGPTGPPNPFSNNTAPSFLRDSQYHPQQHSPAPADPSRSSLVSLSTQDSRKQSLQSVSGKSPTTSTQTAPTSISTSQYDYSAPTSVIASPNTYVSSSQPYSWPSQPPTSQPGSYDARSYNGNSWKASIDSMRMDDKRELTRPAGVPMGQPHSDSIKRQLDSYDVESSLAEIIDGSTKTVEFSKHYATRAHQAPRSGPVLGSLPSVHEIDDLLQLQQRNHEALVRIRNAVLSQEQAVLAEQRAQRRERVDTGYEDGHVGLYQDGFKSPTGFTGGDAKKRRGKAAPPGRCHSCNRAETPEWRRGPDGARTLCNACGLHYAKLTRKMGANKAAALGSNLKPKSHDSSSPVHR